MSAIRALLASGIRDLRVREYPVEPVVRLDGRGPYPLFWADLPDRTQLDGQGVVTATDAAGRRYPNPVSMCLYALGRHSRALTRPDPQPADCAPLVTQATWLRDHQDAAGGWRYPVAVARYRIGPGWYSGMAQGMAASTLLRAYDLTGDDSFRRAADGAVELLLRPVREGGCAEYDSSGRPFLQECPTDPPNHILNGAVFALFGLIEHQNRCGGTAHRPAQERLADELSHFDLGYWSRYDLRWSWPASVNYHALHISLLTAAGRMTGLPAFGHTADRWRRALRHPGHRLRARMVKAGQVWRHRHG